MANFPPSFLSLSLSLYKKKNFLVTVQPLANHLETPKMTPGRKFAARRAAIMREKSIELLVIFDLGAKGSPKGPIHSMRVTGGRDLSACRVTETGDQNRISVVDATIETQHTARMNFMEQLRPLGMVRQVNRA